MTTPTAQVRPDGRLQSDFFAAVRLRGILNAMLEGPGAKFEAMNPGWKVRWEWYPANGDTTLVTAREAMGYRIVDASELDDGTTESHQKTGPIRIGDSVMMAAPEEIHNAILEADALAAKEDLELPRRAYLENLEQTRVKRKDGIEDQAVGVGQITTRKEVVRPSDKDT